MWLVAILLPAMANATRPHSLAEPRRLMDGHQTGRTCGPSDRRLLSLHCQLGLQCHCGFRALTGDCFDQLG